MSNRSITEKVIELRQKYKAEYDECPLSANKTVRKQLLGRFLNDLTDIITSEEKEGIKR